MEQRKVLVIDDEIHVVHVVSIKLRNNDFRVYSANNGSEGYSIALKEKPDIIVLDSRMPALTGLETAQKLLESEETKSIPIILLLSSYSDLLGDTRYPNIYVMIPKPFSPRILLGIIQGILD